MTALYYKPGVAPPQTLAGVTEFDAAGFPWSDLANNPNGRAACGWIEAPALPAFDPETEHVVGTVDGWAVQPLPEPPPAEPVTVRVSKIDFLRLFTAEELVKWNIVKRQVAALVEADYTDPAKALLVQAEIAQDRYKALPENLELTHPETIGFVGTLMVYLDILTPERAAQVLANELPA